MSTPEMREVLINNGFENKSVVPELQKGFDEVLTCGVDTPVAEETVVRKKPSKRMK